MAIIGTPLEIGFYTCTQTPVQALYLNNTEPWMDEAEVLANIPAGSRHKFMMVNIAGELFWFKEDLTTLQSVAETLFQTAEETPIEDAAENYIGENVEEALIEIAEWVSKLKNPFFVKLSASEEVANKITGAVVPIGWSLAASEDVNLVITHNVTDRVITAINVFEIDGATKRMCIPFSEAYTGIIEAGNQITIEGINPAALELHIYIFFS